MVARSLMTLRGLSALGRRRPILVSVFAIAALLTVIFALKAAVHYSYWNEHRMRPVAGWMSPNYIARVWKLDIDELSAAIGTEGRVQNNLPLARIAIETATPQPELIEKINALIEEEHGDPPS